MDVIKKPMALPPRYLILITAVVVLAILFAVIWLTSRRESKPDVMNNLPGSFQNQNMKNNSNNNFPSGGEMPSAGVNIGQPPTDAMTPPELPQR